MAIRLEDLPGETEDSAAAIPARIERARLAPVAPVTLSISPESKALQADSESESAGLSLKVIESHFKRFLVSDPRYFLIAALWCVATHIFESFDAFPYIAITSPARRCGKTRFAELLDMLCARSRRTVGATAAALFRMI